MTRKSKLESIGIAILAGVALVVAGVQKFFETFGVFFPAILLGGGICLYFWSKHRKERNRLIELEKRREKLLEKYQDAEVVENILNKTIWVGETNEQLLESLGAPEDIDQKVLKTKKERNMEIRP